MLGILREKKIILSVECHAYVTEKGTKYKKWFKIISSKFKNILKTMYWKHCVFVRVYSLFENMKKSLKIAKR